MICWHIYEMVVISKLLNLEQYFDIRSINSADRVVFPCFILTAIFMLYPRAVEWSLW